MALFFETPVEFGKTILNHLFKLNFDFLPNSATHSLGLPFSTQLPENIYYLCSLTRREIIYIEIISILAIQKLLFLPRRKSSRNANK